MLQIPVLRENTQEVIDRLNVRNFDGEEIVKSILELDQQRRAIQTESDSVLASRNTISKEIGMLFKSGKAEEANALKAKTGEINAKAEELKTQMNSVESQLHDLLVQIPNLPHASVPLGKKPEDNENIFENADLSKLKDKKHPHWDLAAKYNLIDFELGVKITGAGFPVYKGKGAKLQRGLINFFLSEAEAAGYEEVIPPFLVNGQSGFATGQLPDKEGQMYHATVDDLYLIPTAEVPITNMMRNEIVSAKDFPIKYTAYSPCFRREAGSYGKDVRGLNRLHQFDKVEIVQVQHPDKSYETLEEMVAYVKNILEKLELPYRILRLCGGDMGFTSALTYDFEVYSSAQDKWLEVSSVSNFETYQANRLKLRFKNSEGKKELAHTLNGSALALPRIMAALLENNQTEDGIEIPEVLHRFLSFTKI